MENAILDDKQDQNKVIHPSFRAIEEHKGYRIFLAMLWFAWGIWSFYEGKVRLDLEVEAARASFQALPYTGANTQGEFLTGVLSFLMGIIILAASKERLSYLFAFIGVQLLLFLDAKLVAANVFILIPFFLLPFIHKLNVALGCYLATCLLFVFTGSDEINDLKALFVPATLCLRLLLIFLSAWSYRVIFFSLDKVELRLRFRLFLLVICFYCFIDLYG